MKLLIKAGLVCVALTYSCLISAAGTSVNAVVAEISLNRQYGNYVFIRMAQAPVGAPACSSNGYWHYTLPLTDATGKNIYPILLTAIAANRVVTAAGVGACQEFSTVESLAVLNIVN